MTIDGFTYRLPDIDPQETAEWVDSFHALVEAEGKTRARFLIMKLLERAQELQVGFPATTSTPYLNSIPLEHEPWFPGDEAMEKRIRAFIRWNAAIMVTRANKAAEGIGGHLSTYASSASLYEVGFNHFFRGKDHGQWGDQVFYQGHATPGIYARAYLEGRLDEDDLDHFRRELGREAGRRGLSSYPHPRLMPEFWEFPTVSMGLGPINAIYQARFNRYLLHRGLADTSQAKVWCFVGDGECDEPESLAALSLAAREGLDNLIFVVNCNLQRLDGPVRGNGKIIQELEAIFRGAGWNAIKVIWGSKWDELLARDSDGVLLAKLNATLDGEYQKMATENGAYLREHLFGPDPRLRAMVSDLSDDQLLALHRGGHDHRKLYAAYKSATEHEGSPTVILAKTIKGWCLGSEIEARNATHQIKKMTHAQLVTLRDNLHLNDQIPDSVLEGDLPPYYRPPAGSPEHEYLIGRREALGGVVPRRVVRPQPLPRSEPAVFEDFLQGSKERPVSTTMAFSSLLRKLLRDPGIGKRVVPIIPDEARTFGMDALFSEVNIYAPFGQRYEPVDAGLQLSYRESRSGQILEEGINEAGSVASFTAAGTAYATWGQPVIPFYIFYSMFGFQRTGDALWAVGDMQGKGFLLGATAGRTTLNGEGLQHEDGHSLVLASTVPNLAAYDPAFAYEVATIIRHGIDRMYGCGEAGAGEAESRGEAAGGQAQGQAVASDGEGQGEAADSEARAEAQGEDVFYYLTLYNENYAMPAMPEGCQQGIVDGIYRFAEAPPGPSRRAVILFSGTAQGAAREAQQRLAEHHDVAAELWSVTSYKALREEALTVERWNRLHPTEPQRSPRISETLVGSEGPTVAVTDYMKMVPDQVARWVPGHFVVLGTDGYGRSDTREALRRHFETDSSHVVVAVLKGLADLGDAKSEEVADALARYQIDPDTVEPRLA